MPRGPVAFPICPKGTRRRGHHRPSVLADFSLMFGGGARRKCRKIRLEHRGAQQVCAVCAPGGGRYAPAGLTRPECARCLRVVRQSKGCCAWNFKADNYNALLNSVARLLQTTSISFEARIATFKTKCII